MSTEWRGEGATRRSLIIGAAATAAAAMAGGSHAQVASGPSVRPRSQAVPEGSIPVAFLMDDAATMMDFAGPWEVFQDAGGYHLFTVAPEMKIYDTTGNIMMDGGRHRMTGLRFIPDYSVAECPQPRVIVMGAQIEFAGAAKLAWLRRAAPAAEIVLSVCTGNFVAAHAGLLDGLRATTHHAFFDQFALEFPRVQLVRDQRVVDNGKFVSGGGITAGIDAALHVVRRQRGDAAARRAIEYMEYRVGADA